MPKKGRKKSTKTKTITNRPGNRAVHKAKDGDTFIANIVKEGTGTGGRGSRGGPGSYRPRAPKARDSLRSGGVNQDLFGITNEREQTSALRRRLGGGSLSSAFLSNKGFTGSRDVVRKEDDRVFAEAVLREAKRQTEQENLNKQRRQRQDEAIKQATREQQAIQQQPQEVVGRREILAGGVLSPRTRVIGQRFPEPARRPPPSPLSLGRPATAPQLDREQARRQNNPEQAISQVGGEVKVDTNRLVPWRGQAIPISKRTADEGAKFRIQENREDQIRRIITTPSPLRPAKPPPVSAPTRRDLESREDFEGFRHMRAVGLGKTREDYESKFKGKTREDFKRFQEDRLKQRAASELATSEDLSSQIDTLFGRDPTPAGSDFESDFSGDTSEDIPTIPEDKEAERQLRRQARKEALFPDPLREFRVPPPGRTETLMSLSPARAGQPIPLQPQRAQGDLTQFMINQPRQDTDEEPDKPDKPDIPQQPLLLPPRPEENRFDTARSGQPTKPRRSRPDNLKAYRQDPNFVPFDTPSSEEIVNTPRRRRRPKQQGQGPKPSSPRPKEERPLRPAQFESGAEAYETPSDLSENWISTAEGGGSGGDAEFRRSRRQTKIEDRKRKLERRKQFLEQPEPEPQPATKEDFTDARKELKKQLNQGAIQESIQAQAGAGTGRARRGLAKERLPTELREEAHQLEEEIKNLKRQLSAKGIKKGDIAKAATKKAQSGIVLRLKELGLLDEADTEELLQRLFLAMRRQQQIRNIKKSG